MWYDIYEWNVETSTACWVFTNRDSYVIYTLWKFRTFPLQNFFVPLPSQSLTTQAFGDHWSAFCYYRLVFPVLEMHTNEVPLWLASFTKYIVFEIYLCYVYAVCSFLLLIIPVCISHSFLICFLIDIWVSSFLAFTN